jgi:two-component system sensor histidine kinase TtrS
VVDRTRELEEANLRLRAEMDERRQAEERARRHLEQLAHVDRVSTLGEMAASLAHELHQPLGAIVNYVRGCQRGIDSGKSAPADVAMILEKVVAQAGRAAEIVRRLSGFATRRDARKAPADVNELVLEVAEILLLGTRPDDVGLEFELAEDLPPVDADRIEIQQVLMNLMKNGVEAMRSSPPAERRLLVGTRKSDGGKVEVAISDRGCGFPEDELERLFESFFTTKEEGMGLGLAICRSIVEAHGGRLSARCNADKGLTLRFDLPAAMPV